MKKRSFNFEGQDPEVEKAAKTAAKKLKYEREAARLAIAKAAWQRRFNMATTKLLKITKAQKRLTKRMEALS